jgi:hypothetical protein
VTARGRIAWTVLFALAFGWVEAAVVVYLRRLYYPGGFAFPLRPIEPRILTVELLREGATLLVLLAVGMLAGRRRWERFACFALAFGVWDLAFYGGLRAALGWPSSLADPDILFLLPLPWVAPVYAPVSVALLMVGGAVTLILRESAGWRGRADAVTWALGVAGTAVLLYSFLQDQAAGLGRAAPRPYPAALLVVGDGLLAAAGLRFLARMRRIGPREGQPGGGG